MRISDPNKLTGRVRKVSLGSESAEIIVDIGDQPVTATITAGAAEALNLHEGDKVFTLFKSTDVTLIKNTNH